MNRLDRPIRQAARQPECGSRGRGVVLRTAGIAVLAASVAVTLWFAVLSEAPLPEPQWSRGWNDLAFHFLAFAAITVAGAAVLGPGRAAGLSATLAAGLELVHAAMPSREAAVTDFAAGLGGVACATAGCLALGRIRRGPTRTRHPE